MTRNPLIFALFTRMHLVERVASDIPRMQEAKLPEPEFHTDGMFTVVLKRKQNNYATNDIVNGIVNENEQAITILLRTKPGLNASEIAESISKSWRATMRYLKSLNQKGLLEFRGAPKSGGYYIKD